MRSPIREIAERTLHCLNLVSLARLQHHFSRQHQGWLVSLEVIGLDSSPRVLAREDRLLEIAAEVQADRWDRIEVALLQVDEGGEKQSLSVPGAHRYLTVADVRSAAAALTTTTVVLSQLAVARAEGHTLEEAGPFASAAAALATTALGAHIALPRRDAVLALATWLRGYTDRWRCSSAMVGSI